MINIFYANTKTRIFVSMPLLIIKFFGKIGGNTILRQYLNLKKLGVKKIILPMYMIYDGIFFVNATQNKNRPSWSVFCFGDTDLALNRLS